MIIQFKFGHILA